MEHTDSGRPRTRLAAALCLAAALGCEETRPSLMIRNYGSEVGKPPPEIPFIPPPDASAIELPRGYRAEIVAQNLSYPAAVDLDREGNLYIAEAGYVYGDETAPARIRRLSPSGEMRVVADQLSGPLTDVLWREGRLYVSHRGKISSVDAQGRVTDLVTGLPSMGDHFNNQLAWGPDGKIYFGQGTVTNSGVVGLDNFAFGWLAKHPDEHDMPPERILLTGETFRTPNPFPVLREYTGMVGGEGPSEPLKVKTAAFQPFGRTELPIRGTVKASGTILRMDPDGSRLEVYAWGLRNPYGLGWGPDGRLYASDNGYDERGSRPIGNAPDLVWEIRQGAWYGFPDYAGGIPVTDPRFKPERGPQPRFLLKDHPEVERPLASLPLHSGVGQIEFSRSDRFGFEGQMFIALVGSSTPITGPGRMQNGHEVARVDPRTGKAETFFRVRKEALGPLGLEHTATAGPRRPVGLCFSPDGGALYIADLGPEVILPTAAGPMARPFSETGVIWRVTRERAPAGEP